MSHFLVSLVLAVALWCVNYRLYRRYLAALVTLTLLTLATYVLLPAAPPWMASDRGEIGTVYRISSLGWDYLHLDVVGRLTVLGQQGSNPVAAMPSLHAGGALLVALFCWPLANTLWRGALVAYVLVMAAALVYTGEHYVVDVVAGWLTAAVAVAVGAGVRRHRSPPRSPGDRDAVRVPHPQARSTSLLSLSTTVPSSCSIT